jgi:hypothetical protein
MFYGHIARVQLAYMLTGQLIYVNMSCRKPSHLFLNELA